MVDVLLFALKVLAALTAAVILYLIAAKLIRNFNSEPPPEPGTVPLEDVDYRYRCIVCGAQVVLYAAPEGEPPDAPRHCREAMSLVTPVE